MTEKHTVLDAWDHGHRQELGAVPTKGLYDCSIPYEVMRQAPFSLRQSRRRIGVSPLRVLNRTVIPKPAPYSSGPESGMTTLLARAAHSNASASAFGTLVRLKIRANRWFITRIAGWIGSAGDNTCSRFFTSPS